MEGESKKESDSSEEVVKLRERLGEVNRVLLTLEWDKQNNQLNPGMESKYQKLVTERKELNKKISES